METIIKKLNIYKNKYSHVRINLNENSDKLLIVPSGMKQFLSKSINDNVENWFETDFPNYLAKNCEQYSTINFTWFATSQDNSNIKEAYFEAYMKEFISVLSWIIDNYPNKKIILFSSSLASLLTYHLLNNKRYIYIYNKIDTFIFSGPVLKTVIGPLKFRLKNNRCYHQLLDKMNLKSAKKISQTKKFMKSFERQINIDYKIDSISNERVKILSSCNDFPWYKEEAKLFAEANNLEVHEINHMSEHVVYKLHRNLIKDFDQNEIIDLKTKLWDYIIDNFIF